MNSDAETQAEADQAMIDAQAAFYTQEEADAVQSSDGSREMDDGRASAVAAALARVRAQIAEADAQKTNVQEGPLPVADMIYEASAKVKEAALFAKEAALKRLYDGLRATLFTGFGDTFGLATGATDGSKELAGEASSDEPVATASEGSAPKAPDAPAPKPKVDELAEALKRSLDGEEVGGRRRGWRRRGLPAPPCSGCSSLRR